MKIHHEQLVDAFSDCVGQEKASAVIESICHDKGYDTEHAFDRDEAIEIAAQVANQPDTSPFVRTAANTLQTRIRTGNV